MRVAAIVSALALVSAEAFAQVSPTLTADDIMAHVAANQDRSEKLRTHYVYKQRVRISSRRTDGKLMREEACEYHVVPAADGTQKELKAVRGRYWYKDRYLEFTGEPIPDEGIDAELVGDFRDDVTNDGSKDGVARNLFPLTTSQQVKYRFKLLGRQEYQGRKIYRIGFAPPHR